MEPLVSVKMHTFGQHGFLEESANSILTQTYKNIELLLVPVYGDTKTFKVIESIRKDPRVKIIVSNYAMITHQCNLGMYASKGKYSMFFGSDNVFKQDSIEKLVDTAESNSAIVVFSNWFFSDEKLKNLELIKTDDWNIADCSFTLQKEFIKYFPLKFSDKKYRLSKVWELMLAKPEYKGRIKHISYPTFIYRRHGMQISRRGSQHTFKCVRIGNNTSFSKFYRRDVRLINPVKMMRRHYCAYVVNPKEYLKHRDSFLYKRVIIHWNKENIGYIDKFSDIKNIYNITHKKNIMGVIKQKKLNNGLLLDSPKKVWKYLFQDKYKTYT